LPLRPSSFSRAASRTSRSAWVFLLRAPPGFSRPPDRSRRAGSARCFRPDPTPAHRGRCA